jgi:hypothetical protein
MRRKPASDALILKIGIKTRCKVTNSWQPLRIASPLSLRKSAIVLKFGARRPDELDVALALPLKAPKVASQAFPLMRGFVLFVVLRSSWPQILAPEPHLICCQQKR